MAPWPHPDQRRPLVRQVAMVAGGADALSDALTAYAGHRERQGRRRAVADAVGAVAAAQRAAQGAAGAAGMPRAAGWRSGDWFVAQRERVRHHAAVAAFEPLREREAQRERVRPISISESSEDGG